MKFTLEIPDDRPKGEVRVRVVIPVDEKQGMYLKPEMGVSVTFINKDVDPELKKRYEPMLAAEENKPESRAKPQRHEED